MLSTLKIEQIDQHLKGHGFEHGVFEVGDEHLAEILWDSATEAMQNQAADYALPTIDEVAQRVANTYAVLYGLKAAS